MNMQEAIQKYGHRRDSLSIGDYVLFDGSDSVNGNYIILARIESISLPDATVREVWKYYLNGNEFPCNGAPLTAPLDSFKESIEQQMKEAKEFWEWFMKRWKEDEEKYGP